MSIPGYETATKEHDVDEHKGDDHHHTTTESYYYEMDEYKSGAITTISTTLTTLTLAFYGLI